MKPIVYVIKRHIYLVAKYHIFNIANMRRLVVDFQPIIQLFFKKVVAFHGQSNAQNA